MFHSKKIDSRNNIGQILKRARERSGLCLAVLARQLDIKIDYLKSIEVNNWQSLPGEFYIKTYVKKYAQSLRIPWPSIKPVLEQELKIYQKWNSKTNKQTKISKKHFVVMPRILSKIILFGAIIILFSYLGYQVWYITSPPKLEILNPSEQSTFYLGQTFIVSGTVESGARLEINSQEVFPDETGFFSLQLDLSSGLNLIKIKARKRYSRAAVVEREVVVE